MSIMPISLSGEYAAEPAGPQGVSFWPRVGARLIDTVVHVLVGFLTGMLFTIMLVVASGGHIPRLVLLKLHHRSLTGFLFAILGALAYNVIFTTVHGSTVGKRVLSMVVVQEDGTPCRFKGAVIRELAYFVDALFFGLIAYVAMQGTDEQQRHGDQWAHTLVCKRNALTPDKLRGGSRFALALVFALIADSALIMTSLLLKIAG